MEFIYACNFDIVIYMSKNLIHVLIKSKMKIINIKSNEKFVIARVLNNYR